MLITNDIPSTLKDRHFSFYKTPEKAFCPSKPTQLPQNITSFFFFSFEQIIFLFSFKSYEQHYLVSDFSSK